MARARKAKPKEVVKAAADRAERTSQARRETGTKEGGMPRGRPTTYSPQIAAMVCQKIAEGMTLKAICRDESFPADSTVRTWARDDTEAFYAPYARAREIGYMKMAEDILDIADGIEIDPSPVDGDEKIPLSADQVQRDRLRVDTRKWLLAKALPKIYGDKLTLEGDLKMRMSDEMLDQQIALLAAKAGIGVEHRVH